MSKKHKKIEKNIYSHIFSQILLSIIFVLSSLIYTNNSDKNHLLYKSKVIDSNFKYGKFRTLYNKYINNVNSTQNNTKDVFREETPTKVVPFLDGEKIQYGNTTNIKAIQSGIVVYIGQKEQLGNTIIIQGVDDIDIWYSNIDNINLKLYDYVEKDQIIGEVDQELYLNIIKNNEHVKYDDYIKTI